MFARRFATGKDKNSKKTMHMLYEPIACIGVAFAPHIKYLAPKQCAIIFSLAHFSFSVFAETYLIKFSSSFLHRMPPIAERSQQLSAHDKGNPPCTTRMYMSRVRNFAMKIRLFG